MDPLMFESNEARANSLIGFVRVTANTKKYLKNREIFFFEFFLFQNLLHRQRRILGKVSKKN